jgi:aspartate aminotransferase-like enzyme
MKYRLLAPGPTPVPDRVLREMSRTVIHHRTSHFENIFSQCQKGLSWLLKDEAAPLVLTCSGTGAFEAAIQNFFSSGDTVLCITGGKFGENWLKMSRQFGLNAIEIPVSWGEAVKIEEVEGALNKNLNVRGVLCVASETSTGVRQPYEKIGQLIKNRNECLFVVDGVTAVGVFDIEPKKDNIDVLIAGVQKGMMLPPGLGLLWASEKAWQRQTESDLPKFYFDMAKEKKAQANCQTGHTPAVTLVVGLLEALKMMQEEGRENIFLRHDRIAKATREGIQALGLELFAKNPSQALTSVYTPKSLDANAVYAGLRDMANLTIAGGQEKYKGKIFRIGHMGYVDEIDILTAFSALEVVLRKLGYEEFHLGASIAAAIPYLEHGFEKNRS